MVASLDDRAGLGSTTPVSFSIVEGRAALGGAPTVALFERGRRILYFYQKQAKDHNVGLSGVDGPCLMERNRIYGGICSAEY